jgi:staphyloferrin B biosynthesis citrate synthase
VSDARIDRFRSRLRAGEALDGVIVRTPSHQVIEVLAAGPGGGPDVVVLDTEHAPFSVDVLDSMLAVSNALDVVSLVRIDELRRAAVQSALDMGATGVVVPHVRSADDAARAVRWAHYGPDGRGFSGSTRAGRWGTRSMAEVLAAAASRTTVVVQVEDPDAVEAITAIVAVDGVDAVFVGAADLAVAMGASDPSDERIVPAIEHVVSSCVSVGMPVVGFAASADAEAAWRARGAAPVVRGTDQARLLS